MYNYNKKKNVLWKGMYNPDKPDDQTEVTREDKKP